MKTDKQKIDALTNEVKSKTETIHELLNVIEKLKGKDAKVTEKVFHDIFEEIVILFSELKTRENHIRMVNLLRARHGITITDLEQ